ncbi:class I adenylate-forming enzyme family protein [Methylacidimicrobium cyclopophantes]|uniref:class I adenylate-forming enzyme family protein n=1 Tax=Methylacidimicrobium cyclopophantes TaxID=1041766 RepID=UPI002482BB5C|nr:fatty acid--CoA ligase family protein [Methylacidimicrobium cyclopophantes]
MGSQAAFPNATALWRLWEKTVSRLSAEPALLPVESREWIRFRDIDSTARRFAREHLAGSSRAWVAFSLPNGPEWIAAFLACQAAGAAAMPLDATIPFDARASTARALGASYLWTSNGLEPLDPRRRRVGYAVVKTSSGSRREAAALPFSAEAMIEDGQNTAAAMGTSEKDRALALLPFGHSYALGSVILPLLLCGLRIVSAEEFLASQIPSWIRKYEITFFPSVPDIWQTLGRLPSASPPLPSLRLAVSAGAVLSGETARRIYDRFSVKIHSLYGSSETGSICYDASGDATLEGRSVGRPLPRVSVTITPSGRVSVSGRALYGRCRRVILPDLAQWNVAGELRLLGRADPAVTIGGRKIHPAEIEAVLRRLPSVTDAHVRSVRSGTRTYLIAAVESPRSAGELLGLLAKSAPSWKIPRFLVCLPRLPRNARGKVEERTLRELFHETYPQLRSAEESTIRPAATSSSDSRIATENSANLP